MSPREPRDSIPAAPELILFISGVATTRLEDEKKGDMRVRQT